MANIVGFKLVETGKLAGCLEIDFSYIQIHGRRGTPEYLNAMKLKAKMVLKTLDTEFRAGTKHYNSKGNLLKTIKQVLDSYAIERKVYLEFFGSRREKFELLMKKYGVEKAKDEESDG